MPVHVPAVQVRKYVVSSLDENDDRTVFHLKFMRMITNLNSLSDNFKQSLSILQCLTELKSLLF